MTWFIRTGLPLIMLLMAESAAAGNLLNNPDFDRNKGLIGWTTKMASGTCPMNSDCGHMYASASECCGRANSGSASSTSAFSQFDQLSQCVHGIEADTSYDVSVWIQLTPSIGFNQAPKPGFGVAWYASADCTGPALTNSTTSVKAAAWQQFSLPAIVAPDKAGSARFSLFASYQPKQNAVGNPVRTDFDNAFFGPSATVPVELQSFSVD
jgi:hypothetical protein